MVVVISCMMDCLIIMNGMEDKSMKKFEVFGHQFFIIIE